MPNKYTAFGDRGDGTHEIWNIVYNVCVGLIQKNLLCPFSDTKFSNGCIKEILAFIYTEKIEDEKQEFMDRGDGTYEIWNKTQDDFPGLIKKERMGRWMHWCLCPFPDKKFSYPRLKEISQFITSLYSKGREENAIRRSNSKKGS